jgi:hypothetical protein
MITLSPCLQGSALRSAAELSGSRPDNSALCKTEQTRAFAVSIMMFNGRVRGASSYHWRGDMGTTRKPLVTFDLSGNKPDVHQLVATEFHLPAVCKCSHSLVVWHFRYPANFNYRRHQILGEGGGASTVRFHQPQTRQRQKCFRQYKLPVPINSIFGRRLASRMGVCSQMDYVRVRRRSART